MANTDKEKIIAGYAAVYFTGEKNSEYLMWEDSEGILVERLAKGCFDKALARKDLDVVGRFNHSDDLLLGRTPARTVRVKADDIGLYFEIDVDDTPTGQNVAGHVGRGDVVGASFAFIVKPEGQLWSAERMPDGRIREVRDIIEVDELFDVSPCTHPAYKATSVYLRTESDVIFPARSLVERPYRVKPDFEFEDALAFAQAKMAQATHRPRQRVAV